MNAKQEMEAQLRYGRLAVVSGRRSGKTAAQERMAEEWMERNGMKLQDWQRPYVRGILGKFDYTPADELRDRLNDSLQGKPPALAVNTRYWRGL